MIKKLCLYAAGALLALATAPADATTLLGDQIKVGWRLPTESQLFAFSVSPSPVVTVGAGIEGIGQLTNVSMSIDFDADSLVLTFLTNANFTTNPFNGIYFQQMGEGRFGDVAEVTGIAGSLVHDIGTALSINFAGQKFAPGDMVTVRFLPGVPEIGTWAMMIVGMGTVGVVQRRRSARRMAAAFS